MAAPTLTVNGITFTFNEGDVSNVKPSIETRSEVTEIAGTGPMGAQIYDYDGVTKTITLIGNLTEAATTRTSSGTVKTILAQKQWLESLGQGSQNPITFTSTYDTQSVSQASGAASPYQAAFTGTICMVSKIDFDEVQGNPNKLSFTIILIVGIA